MQSLAELNEMARAYQKSALVMALVQLDICTALDTPEAEGATPSTLAQSLALDERMTAVLLAAAVALGLLENREGRYFNTPLSADCLSRQGKRYQGVQISGYADQYPGWSRLAEGVKKGQPVLPSLHHDAGQDPALRRLILSLHNGGKNTAPLLMPHLAPELGHAGKLLDVGCGAGTYALAFAEAYPGLAVTLFDRPAVLKIAEEVAQNNPVLNRTVFRPADYKQDSLGEQDYDLVLFFQVLRTESPATIRQLLKKAATALRPGGAVAIYDTYLDESRTSPPENVFQNLTMALTYAEGGLFTPTDLAGWLEEAGFGPARLHPIQAVRPMALYVARLNEEVAQ